MMQDAPVGAATKQDVAPPKKPRFFYGWVIVAVSFLQNMMAYGAGPAAFSIFLQPMTSALGWSRTTMTVATTFQSIGNLVVTPILGPMVDKYGPKYISVFGAAVAATAFLLMGGVSEPWHFYILYMFATALGLHEMGGFVTATTIAKWFIKKRGRAIAIAMLGTDIGVIVLVPMLAFLIEHSGWQVAWQVLGIVLAVLVIPASFFFMRRSPEDHGMLPDGEQQVMDAQGQPTRRAAEVTWTLREALSHRTTWILIAATQIASIAINATINHQVAFFTDIGLTLSEASLAFVVNRIAAMVGKTAFGFIVERVPVRYCLMITNLGRVAGFMFLLLGTGTWRVWGFAIVSGLLSNAWGSLQNQIWADYYGRTFVGTIRGTLAPFNLFSTVGGTIFAAFIYDTTGSYVAAFWLFCITLLTAAGIMFFATPPVKKPAAQTEVAQ